MNFKRTITTALVIAAMGFTVTPATQNFAPVFKPASITAEATDQASLITWTKDLGTVWVANDTYIFNTNTYAYRDANLTTLNSKNNKISSGTSKVFVEFWLREKNYKKQVVGKTKAGSFIPLTDFNGNLYVNAYVKVVSNLNAQKDWYAGSGNAFKCQKKYYRVIKLSPDYNWGYVENGNGKYGWLDLSKVTG